MLLLAAMHLLVPHCGFVHITIAIGCSYIQKSGTVLQNSRLSIRRMSSSEDDVPMSSLRKSGDDSASKRRRSQVNYAEEGDDDDDFDDEDDVPLAALASPSPKKTKKAESSNSGSAKKKRAAPPKKKSSSTASTASSKTSSSSTNFKSASDALYGSECDKGLLIQRLLCRWWYAIDWPDQAAIPEEPPKHYDPLDGFPGVFVCTKGEEVGSIKDFRDKATCPNFKNMAKKSAEELQGLLIKALTEQKRQLVAAEGPGTETQKEIEKLLKWTNKVSIKSADKKATSVLKAAKFTLD